MTAKPSVPKRILQFLVSKLYTCCCCKDTDDDWKDG